MSQALRTIATLFATRLPERAFNLVFRCDWRPIRFIMSLVFVGAATVQTAFALSPQMLTIASLVYVLAALSSIMFAAFYLFISTNDQAAHDQQSLRWRYLIELLAFLLWILIAFVDWYAYTNRMIFMDAVSWQHHIIINAIVSLTLCCAFLNAMSLAIQSEMYERYRAGTDDRERREGEDDG